MASGHARVERLPFADVQIAVARLNAHAFRPGIAHRHCSGLCGASAAARRVRVAPRARACNTLRNTRARSVLVTDPRDVLGNP